MDKSYFLDKPVIILGTNKLTSFIRASERDERNIRGILSNIYEYINTYDRMGKSLNELSNTVQAEIGRKYIEEYFK